MATIDELHAIYLSGTEPHPHALKVTVDYILPARMRRIAGARKALRNIVRTYSEFADHLARLDDGRADDVLRREGMHQPTGDTFDTRDFDVPGFVGRTRARLPLGAGIQLRTFTVFEAAGTDATGHIAELAAIEHIRGLWEVVDVEVIESRRRSGIATHLYDAVEKFIGAPIFAPSGWLTADALEFWTDRRPGRKLYFVPHPDCSKLLVSPKQLIFCRMAHLWKMPDDAEPDVRERLS